MRKKSHAKGSRWERKFARDLSLWWSRGKDEFVFRRRSGSGGAPRDLSGRSGQPGDVVADKPEGLPLTSRVVVELKHYRASVFPRHMTSFLFDKGGFLVDAFMQAYSPARTLGRIPLLVVKYDYLDPFVLTTFPLGVCWELRHSSIYLFSLAHLFKSDPDEVLELLSGDQSTS